MSTAEIIIGYIVFSFIFATLLGKCIAFGMGDEK